MPVGPGLVALAGQVALLLALSCTPPLALAQTPPAQPPQTARAYPFESLPGVGDSEQIRRMWRQGLDLEARGELLESAHIYEGIVRLLPGAAPAYWRIAKNYWRYGDALAEARSEERTVYFRRAEDWAERGIDVDASCGECYLYRAAGMGSQLRSKGRLAAAREVSEIAENLERGIALLEQRPDRAYNPELEELYYAAARLYRSVPDSRLLSWLIGVRGDRRRALDYMRKAYAISGERPEYMAELGADLLCVAREESDQALSAEGVEILQALDRMRLADPKDAVYQRRARSLLAHPEHACDDSSGERGTS